MDVVTGGAGFVGSHLVDLLLSKGRPVRVIDTLAAGPNDPAQRKLDAVRRWRMADAEVFRGDLEDPEILDEALRNARRVYHLAAAPNPRASVAKPEACLKTNVLATQTLLSAMERHKVGRLVLVSSSAVYATAGDKPSHEDEPFSPASPYGASKVAAEALAIAWQNLTGGSLSILRPFTIYGPRQRPDMAVSRFATSIASGRPVSLFGDGSSTRDYIYVKDAVELMLASASVVSRKRPAIFNVGTGKPTRLLRLVELIEKAVGRTAKVECLPRQAGDVKSTWADTARVEKILKRKPAVDLERGIRRTVRWMAEAQGLKVKE